ncbi:MAG: hypothetical protein CM1200mP36_02220 [Gammaproteobacteria bacterium]|nr:MAG: hypothetical protein CM1200mP36_02220 [Gammaproteobacteria bacterium]
MIPSVISVPKNPVKKPAEAMIATVVQKTAGSTLGTLGVLRNPVTTKTALSTPQRRLSVSGRKWVAHFETTWLALR